MFKTFLTIGNYKVKILKTISQGAYGFIYLVDEKKTNKKMALKKMIVQNEERYQLALKELNFLKNHASSENNNYIQYFDSSIEKEGKNTIFYILIEFCESGTLFGLIEARDKENKKLEESEILQIAKIINSGLLELHKKSLIHCDLKIENLLFYSFECIKMCDFGSINDYNFRASELSKDKLSHILEEIDKQTTFMYRPPEMCDMFLNYKVDTKVDMWMFGCVLYTLLFFKHPFVDSSKNGIINASFFWKQTNISPRLENLIRNLLTPDPQLRYSSLQVQQILNNWKTIQSIPLNPIALKIKTEQSFKNSHNQVGIKKKKKNMRQISILLDSTKFPTYPLKPISPKIFPLKPISPKINPIITIILIFLKTIFFCLINFKQTLLMISTEKIALLNFLLLKYIVEILFKIIKILTLILIF